jgi:hypothetical protein
VRQGIQMHKKALESVMALMQLESRAVLKVARFPAI